MPTRSKLCYLKNIEIFANLTDEEYGILDRCTSIREIKKGEILYSEGSKDNNIYILLRGVVKITKLLPLGKEIILDIVKGGAIIGEMVVVDSPEKDESVQVMEEGLLCTMKKMDFTKLLQFVPGFAVRVARIMGPGAWRRKLEAKLIDFLYSTVEQRLAKTFLDLIEHFGLPHGKGYLINIKLSHKDYADLVASSRETVTVILNKLRRNGLIDFEDKYVMIKSMDKLRAVAAGK
jgi:CRP/FNR family transcriptional regulator, cyclic AMP receptor protein